MRRVASPARKHWQKLVEDKGLTYHTLETGKPYWNESAYYAFRMEEVDRMEAATNELHGMCLEAAGHIIEKKRYPELGIRADWVPLIEKTWNEEPPAIYGRFDLWYDDGARPKLLEYNADTPTGLVEAAVTQWYWLQDLFPKNDQWNSIHERLVAKWRELRQWLPGGLVHFLHMDSAEDFMTVAYLADTAREAGLLQHVMPIGEVGSDHLGSLIDNGVPEREMKNIFKLYPWEWLLKDEYARLVNLGYQQWLEPAWKMLLSNKGIMAVLWEMYPNHPNLLPTFLREPRGLDAWARKPLMSREGANITFSTKIDAETVNLQRTGGLYGNEGFVYQELCTLPEFDGKHPVIGSWVIDGVSAGCGVRESADLITGNLSQFVPHMIDG